MARDWDLEIGSEGARERGTVRLWLKGQPKGDKLEVISACASLEAFQGEINRLKDELDGFLDRAREEFSSTSAAVQVIDPAQAWKEMETFADEREMFHYFNELSEPDRERVADYVLTQVSMFKGRGPVFSEHYDAATHRLD